MRIVGAGAGVQFFLRLLCPIIQLRRYLTQYPVARGIGSFCRRLAGSGSLLDKLFFRVCEIESKTYCLTGDFSAVFDKHEIVGSIGNASFAIQMPVPSQSLVQKFHHILRIGGAVSWVCGKAGVRPINNRTKTMDKIDFSFIRSQSLCFRLTGRMTCDYVLNRRVAVAAIAR